MMTKRGERYNRIIQALLLAALIFYATASLFHVEHSQAGEQWVECERLTDGLRNHFKGASCPANWVLIRYVIL